jgi:hypothetical protein
MIFFFLCSLQNSFEIVFRFMVFMLLFKTDTIFFPFSIWSIYVLENVIESFFFFSLLYIISHRLMMSLYSTSRKGSFDGWTWSLSRIYINRSFICLVYMHNSNTSLWEHDTSSSYRVHTMNIINSLSNISLSFDFISKM